jgi:hypothetical protein
MVCGPREPMRTSSLFFRPLLVEHRASDHLIKLRQRA